MSWSPGTLRAGGYWGGNDMETPSHSSAVWRKWRQFSEKGMNDGSIKNWWREHRIPQVWTMKRRPWLWKVNLTLSWASTNNGKAWVILLYDHLESASSGSSVCQGTSLAQYNFQDFNICSFNFRGCWDWRNWLHSPLYVIRHDA